MFYYKFRANAAERQRQARAPRVPQGRIDFQQYHRYDTVSLEGRCIVCK